MNIAVLGIPKGLVLIVTREAFQLYNGRELPVISQLAVEQREVTGSLAYEDTAGLRLRTRSELPLLGERLDAYLGSNTNLRQNWVGRT